MHVLEREAHAPLVLLVEPGVGQQAVERLAGGEVAAQQPRVDGVLAPRVVAEAAVAARRRRAAAAGGDPHELGREAAHPLDDAIGAAGELGAERDAGAAGDEALHQTVTGSRAPISRRAFSAVRRLRSESATSDTHATCGVRITFGASSSGLSSGSGSISVTSSAAPAMCPECSAATSASSSTRPPRPMLMTSEPGCEQGELAGADHVARLGRQRDVQRQDVGTPEQLVEPEQLDTVGRAGVRVVRHDLQAERARLLRHAAADAAVADESERALRQPRDRLRRGDAGAAAPHGGVEREQLARERQQQRDRVVGDLLVAVLGHVADGDPELLRHVDVDVVEPDAVAHDGTAGFEPLEVGTVERDDRAGEDRDGVALDGEVEGLLRAQAELLRVDHVVARGLEHAPLDLAVADDAVIDDDDGAHRFVSLARSAWVVRSSRLRIFPLGFLGSSPAMTT